MDGAATGRAVGIEVAAAPRDGRPRRALLIGVGHYSPRTVRGRDGHPVVADLRGPPNDVPLVRNLLVQCYGFRPEDVRELVDEQATLANVVTAIHDHLVVGVTSETEVLLWFAGHGSRVRDPSGREPSGFDSTLVLHDSRVGANDGAHDLDDDALHSLLAASPSEHITVVTDACHSGDVTRDVAGFDARYVADVEVAPAGPPARKWPFWPADVEFLEDGDPRRPDESAWLHVAACATTERAFEYSPPEAPLLLPDRRRFGVLTHALCEALLRDAMREVAWDAVVYRARAAVRRLLPGQNPQLHGSGQARVVFGTTRVARPGGHPARVRDADRLWVDAGVVHRLRAGVQGDVIRLVDRTRVGTARIESADLASANARWIDGPLDTLDQDSALWFLPDEAGGGRAPLPVLRPASAELAALLADDPTLTFVDGADDAYVVVGDADAFEIHAPDGFVVWPRAGFGSDPAGRVAACRQEADFQWLWSLGELTGRDTVASLSLRPDERSGGSFDPTSRRAEFAAAPGAELDATLRIELSRGMHVLVLDLEPGTRSVVAAWPPSKIEATAKPRHDTSERGMTISVPAAPGSGRCFDRLLLVASDRTFELNEFVFDGLSTDRYRGVAVPEAFAALEPDSWAIDHVDLVLR